MIKKIFNVENSWVFIMLALITWMVYTIISGDEYIKAFNFIIPGIRITFGATFVSFLIALILGLFLGIGRISDNIFLSTISRTYIEFVRGIPILILIFTMAFVVVVDAAEFLNINNGNVPMIIRAIIALSVFMVHTLLKYLELELNLFLLANEKEEHLLGSQRDK